MRTGDQPTGLSCAGGSAPHGSRPWSGPALAAGSVAAATAYTTLVDPNRSAAFPRCITRWVTGLDCPMCGGLRAVHDLASGHLAEAVDHNLVVVVMLALIVAAWLAWLSRSLGAEPPAVRWPPWARWVALGVVLAFTVARNTALPGLAWLDSA